MFNKFFNNKTLVLALTLIPPTTSFLTILSNVKDIPPPTSDKTIGAKGPYQKLNHTPAKEKTDPLEECMNRLF